MSNKQLPAEVQLSEEIKKRLTDEANAYATSKVGDIQTIPASKVNEWEKAADGWEAGATAENERAQVLVDALEWLKTYGPMDDLTIKFIDNALNQWKGKEVEKFTRFALECAITAIPLSVIKSDGEYFKAGDGKRFVAFRWVKDENNARLSIREDGDARYVFNGVVTSVDDFKKAWALTILY